MNISDILERQAEQSKDTPCLFINNEMWTRNDLNRKVWQAASIIYAHGVRPGDVVAQSFISLSNQLVAMLATARLGATVFSLAPNTPEIRQRELLKTLQAKFLATDLTDHHCADITTILVKSEENSDSRPFMNNDPSIRANNPNAPWIIVTGSGSTGKRKLLPITHEQQWNRLQAGLEWLPYSKNDTLHSLVHLDYYFAKQRYLEAILKGAAIELVNSRTSPLHASVLYGTVFHVEQFLMALPQSVKGHMEHLTALMIGGSPVSPALRERIRERLCSKLYILYGTNECHTTCRTSLNEVYGIPGNVGRPHQGFTLQIVDNNDEPQPADKAGHIRIKSSATIDGYLHDEEATARAFRNGWFYPGDLGRMTPDGQLIHLGRSDDMMIMNGINIYPAEIEQIIASHPDVHDAVALPLKHAVHQDIPVCAIVLKKNSAITERKLLDFTRERLGPHAPHRIFILDSIPRNEQGKPVRIELQKLIAARQLYASGTTNMSTERGSHNIGIPKGRQLQKLLTCSFIMPQNPDMVTLDLWLNKVLDNDLKEHDDIRFPGANSAPPETRQWLWRCLQLSRLLLQAGRAAVFDPPGIIACTQKNITSRKWNAVVSIPLIDDFPNAMYDVALKTSFSLAGWAAVHEPEGDNLNHFFDTIQQRVIEPLSKMLPVGKSTFPVLQTAYGMGIPFRHLGGGVFQLGWGANARRMDRSTTEIDSAMGAKLSQSKVLTTRLLQSAGLPAPQHTVVPTHEKALLAARQIGWPVVVKPADRDRGEGVSVDITNNEALKKAFNLARNLSPSKQVIVERQVPGICHRLFIANGKLLYAVKRLPLSVTGNGSMTVAGLISAEWNVQQSKPPWKRTEIRPLDQMALDSIAEAGLRPDSVPEDGRLVPLRKIESTQWGGVDEEVMDRIHPENLRIAIEAASLFGLHVAGLDIITSDIAKPWYQNGAIINEVNFAPLFGGGEISRQHIPVFLRDFMKGNGRIPVDVFSGGTSALNASLQQWEALRKKGVQAYLTNAEKTFSPSGKPLIMPFKSTYLRVRALALSAKVEAIVIALQSDEFLDSGLPLEFVETVTIFDEPLISFSNPGKQVSPERHKSLQILLKNWRTTDHINP